VRAADYFSEYREFFVRRGCDVLTVQLAGDAKCEVRALQLRDQIARWNRGHAQAPYSLIAHSQGGLDARFAVATLDLKPRAVLTIGTPHLGTPIAEFVSRPSWGRWLVSLLLSLGGYDLASLSFPAEMTADFLRESARYFELRNGVSYGAAQGRCLTQCHGALRWLSRWKTGEGDGLVSAASQRGETAMEDLGAFDLDHISEVGVEPEKRAERSHLLEVLWGRVRVPPPQ
jgi:hypothetical protein